MWNMRWPALLAILVVGCSSTEPEIGTWVYQQPERTGDGWQTTSLTNAGLDERRLALMMEILQQNPGHLVHGIVIAVDGALAFEEYFPGRTHPAFGEVPVQFTRERKHGLSSVTKSVTSTMLGIAIDHGFISSIDASVFDFFPEHADLSVGRKGDITLKHLVTMSAGLEWDESTYPYADSRNDLARWYRFPGDLVRFVLELPMVADPGTQFLYNSSLPNVLGEVIRRATGMRLDQFADEYLFAPLGITDYLWHFVRPDFVYASGDISLRLRDMARLGQLYLQDGMWNGERVLSSAWVQASASPAFTIAGWWGHVGYGYGWWPKSSEYGASAFAAAGWGDQAIIVMPEYDMVAVFTGGAYWRDALMSSHDMTVGFVLPDTL
jgi:CubicO group peptidase (beta-lactamase class C family)